MFPIYKQVKLTNLKLFLIMIIARPKLSKRQQSVMQYMRDQASIDDDPVAFLSVSIIFIDDVERINKAKRLQP